MTSQIADSLSGLIPFLAYFGGGIVLLLLFSFIYLRVTPYHEIELVRQGKTAPAISFGGALIGFVCPLYSAISHSVNMVDMLIWAIIALVVQILVFIVLRIMFSHLIEDIAQDHIGSALLLAFASVAAGLINAASMTY